jgi:hypothetical protein
MVADAIQLALIPLFAEEAISPMNSVLDVVIGFVMVRLIGWHFAFLPTFVAELVPGARPVPELDHRGLVRHSEARPAAALTSAITMN